MDEIKLYGEMESNEALDESFSEESFSELKSVISKVSKVFVFYFLIFTFYFMF